MANAPRNDAPRGREQGSCSRTVTTVTTAGYLLLAIGLALLAGCAAADKARVEPANAGIDKGLVRLARFVPSRYDKPTVASESLASRFEAERPAPPAAPVVKKETPAADPASATAVEQGKDAARAAEGSEHGTSAKE